MVDLKKKVDKIFEVFSKSAPLEKIQDLPLAITAVFEVQGRV